MLALSNLDTEAFLLDHGAPSQPLDTDSAHQVMRQHLDCAASSCSRKRAAYRALVTARHITPDVRAERYLQ